MRAIHLLQKGQQGARAFIACVDQETAEDKECIHRDGATRCLATGQPHEWLGIITSLRDYEAMRKHHKQGEGESQESILFRRLSKLVCMPLPACADASGWRSGWS
jgi:hypothetical protein